MSASSSAVQIVAGGVVLRLHVQPGARRTEMAGLHGERLKVRVAAPPVDGAANEALLGWLADAAGIARSRLSLLRGATSRQKDVLVMVPESHDAAAWWAGSPLARLVGG